MSYQPNIFTKIIAKEVPATIVFEDDQHLVINDINPQDTTHVLVLPKANATSIEDMDTEKLGQLMATTTHVAKKILGLTAYKVGINIHAPYQEVPHVHVHIMSSQTTKSEN